MKYNREAKIRKKGSTSDGFGGVEEDWEILIRRWRCRLQETSSSFNIQRFGMIENRAFRAIGEATDTEIIPGYILDLDSENYRIIIAKKMRDESGRLDHWKLDLLRVE